MKKILLMGLMAAFGLTLTSCNEKSDDPNPMLQSTVLIPSYNHFSSISGKENPFVAIGNYNYTTKYPDNTVSIAVSSMSVPGGGTASFTTPAVGMKASIVEIDGKKAEVVSFSIPYAENNTEVSDIRCKLSQAVYTPPQIEGFNDAVYVPSSTNSYTVMEYLYGGWRVRTFWPDMTFRGKTVTTGRGMTEPFETDNIVYRVVMKLGADNKITSKADLRIYKARFASNMRNEINLIELKDLDLKFTNNGYEITGKDVVPLMLESGEMVENTKFVFNDVKLAVGGDLTIMSAQYVVASVYTGIFNGASIIK